MTAIAVCSWGSESGGCPSGTQEALTLARRVSAELNAELIWLVPGPLADWTMDVARRYGVMRVDHVADAKLATFQPDPYVEALAQYCAQYAPRAVLFSQTFDVRVVAPRLAARLGSAVVMNAADLETGGGPLRVTASAYGGDTRAVYELAGPEPSIVAVSPNAVVPQPVDAPASEPTVREVAVDLADVEERIRVVSRSENQGPRLEDADIIVAGGRGLGSPENYKLVERLAEALGGMAGASRPIVDDGWADPSRQVGLTGKLTRPALYVAAGISGASQHMVGCAGAKVIVAINRDPDAAVFRYARFGVVGDCLEILPEMIRAVRK